jgi:hypothetical protein
MGFTGPFNEDAGKDVESRTDSEKHGWAPDVGKEGTAEGHEASEKAMQGAGKSAGEAEGTQS